MRIKLLFKYSILFCLLYLSTYTPKLTATGGIDQLLFKIIVKDSWSTHARKGNIQSAAYQLFFDNQEWSFFWQQWFGGTIPSVDFKQNFIVYVLQGLKKTGGYEIDIVNAGFEKKRNKLHITLRIIEPGPGQPVDLGETSPYVIVKVKLPVAVKIKSSDLQVNFTQQIDSKKISIELIHLSKKHGQFILPIFLILLSQGRLRRAEARQPWPP